MNTMTPAIIEDLREQIATSLAEQGLAGATEHVGNTLILVMVAAITKFGGTPEEAAFKFVEAVETICKEDGAFLDHAKPTLTDKLMALKLEVGDELFNKLLSNPEVERMAHRSYGKRENEAEEKAISGISALFNGALDRETLVDAVDAIFNTPNPIQLLTQDW